MAHASTAETGRGRGSWRTPSAARRRRVALLLICVIAGALLSIVVVQLAAARSSVASVLSSMPLPARSVRLPGYLRSEWTEATTGERHDKGSFGVSHIEIRGSVPLAATRETSGEQQVDSVPILTVSRLSFGWPFRCLHHDNFLLSGRLPGNMELIEGLVDRAGWRFGAYYPRWVPVDRTWERRIPRAAHWGGLVLNTAFYGSLLFLAIAGPGIVRRARRRRQGRCEWCGYPAGVSAVCTECGATLGAIGQKTPA